MSKVKDMDIVRLNIPSDNMLHNKVGMVVNLVYLHTINNKNIIRLMAVLEDRQVIYIITEEDTVIVLKKEDYPELYI